MKLPLRRTLQLKVILFGSEKNWSDRTGLTIAQTFMCLCAVVAACWVVHKHATQQCTALYCSIKFKALKSATQRKFNSSNTARLKKKLCNLYY